MTKAQHAFGVRQRTPANRCYEAACRMIRGLFQLLEGCAGNVDEARRLFNLILI